MNKLILVLICLAGLALPSTALARDRDNDGLPDRWERRHDLSTKHGSANKDPDRDRVDNANEYRERTNPRDRDSDGDGRRDGREDADRDGLSNAAEDATGNDPRDRDTDDDGIRDGRERAGVVLSYAGGLLTIDLANGDFVTGHVTEGTKVKCISERAAERRHRRRGRGGVRKAQVEDGDGGDFEPGDDSELEPGEEDDVDYPGGELEDDPDLDDEDWPDDDDDSDEHSDQGKGKREGRSCSASDLRAGVGVHQAELELTAEGLVFERLELVR